MRLQGGNTYDAGKDLLESVGCTGCFGFTPVETVFEFKEGLADWIGEGDSGGIDKCDCTDAPSLKNDQGEEDVEHGERGMGTMRVRAT